MKISVIITFVVAAMFAAGCTHETFLADSKHPEVEYTEDGSLKWHGKIIEPEELPGLLEKSGVDQKSQIDIRVPRNMHSFREPRVLLFNLRRAGYTRGVLVTEKKAYSEVSTSKPKNKTNTIAPTQQQRKIRYK